LYGLVLRPMMASDWGDWSNAYAAYAQWRPQPQVVRPPSKMLPFPRAGPPVEVKVPPTKRRYEPSQAQGVAAWQAAYASSLEAQAKAYAAMSGLAFPAPKSAATENALVEMAEQFVAGAAQTPPGRPAAKEQATFGAPKAARPRPRDWRRPRACAQRSFCTPKALHPDGPKLRQSRDRAKWRSGNVRQRPAEAKDLRQPSVSVTLCAIGAAPKANGSTLPSRQCTKIAPGKFVPMIAQASWGPL